MSDASAPTPDPAPEPDPNTQPTPDPTVPDPAPAPDPGLGQAPGGATVTIRLALPAGSVFAHGIDGAPNITAEGTPIPAEHLDAVHHAARTNGVTIIVAEGDADQ